MVSLLARLFIKDYKSYESERVRQSYGVMCGVLGIFLNILLFAGKLFVGIISNSIAATADAFNNLTDAASSLITAVGFKLAGQEPDIHHPFGHGRIEYISGMIVSFIILLVGVELFLSSVRKIIEPEAVELSTVSIVIMICSVAVKLYMAYYNKNIGKKLNSPAMNAVAKDSFNDSIATVAVIVSFITAETTGINTDGWFGVFVALFIFYSGFVSIRETIGPLLGQPPEKELVEKIESMVLAHPEIVGVHDLIVHDYGPGRRMISIHAEVPLDSDILIIHDIIDNIEKELNEKLGCQAVIHMDPISTNDEKTNEIKRIVEMLVKKIDERLTIHDFRIVTGKTHTNVIFDVVVPYDLKKSNNEVKNEVVSLISEYDRTLYAVVEIDRAII